MEKLSGSCLCGGVQFVVRGPFRPVIACHCTQCRKHTGHYMAASAVLNENFALIEDRGLKWYRSGPASRRGFCGDCGATLFFAADGSDRISFAGGSIDGPTDLQLSAHIYAGEKSDYYTIPTGELTYAGDCAAILQVTQEDGR
ncbi:MAG: GFA family protein [Hyphomicrobiaceae bacterium]